jgi:hypothetical protein
VNNFKKNRKIERKKIKHWILLQVQDAVKKRKEKKKNAIQ